MKNSIHFIYILFLLITTTPLLVHGNNSSISESSTYKIIKSESKISQTIQTDALRLIPKTNSAARSSETSYGPVLYVKKGETGIGTSWTDALGELSKALQIAREHSNVQQIWVAEGTYLPSEQWNAQNNALVTDQPRYASFYISDRIKVYGGFNGTETALSERNPAAHPTILSGKLAPQKANWALHVVLMLNVSSHTVLDGFTIQEGQADLQPGSLNSIGAGLYLLDANPQLANLIVQDNHAFYEGGGMYFIRSNPICNQIQLLNNTAGYYGAALRLGNSNPTFTNIKVIGNQIVGESSYSEAAAIYSSESKPTFINALFTKNVSTSGSFYKCYGEESATFINTVVVDNGSDPVSIQSTQGNTRFFNSIIWGTSHFPAQSTEATSSMIEGFTTNDLQGNINSQYITPNMVFESTDPNVAGYLVPKLNGLIVNKGTADLQVIRDLDGAAIPMPATDLAGNPRIIDQRMDLGPFENQQIASPLPQMLYVKKGSTGSGVSWEDSMGELADALRFAHAYRHHWKPDSPLKIYVAKGTYKPQYSPRDEADFADEGADNTFLMVKDVQLFGGFDPDNGITDLTHRRIFDLTNGTILSGDRLGDDQISGMGIDLAITNIYDNAYHTVVASGDVGSAVLDGFTITGGIGREMYTIIKVKGVTISRMDAGGLYGADDASPVLHNLIFRGNWGYHGGGIGGVATPVISNITFIQNIGTLGAGMWSGSNFTIRNAVFIGNRASNGGGIGFNNNASTVYPVIENATFVGNHAATSGGAIYNLKNAQTTLKNSVIIGNRSGIFNGTGTATDIHNSLVQDLSNTDQGNLDATNVQPEDVFIDFAHGNYRLKHGSPAIDKGSNSIYTGNLQTDLDVSRFKRQMGNRIDMGAYEYGIPPVISHLDGDIFSYIQGDPIQILDQNQDAEVSDMDSPDFDGGHLRVHLTNRFAAEDVLLIHSTGTGTGEIGLNGTTVTFEGVALGKVEGGLGTDDLIIHFNASATLASVTALIRNLAYTNSSNDPTTTQRVIQLILEDGDGGYSETITVKGNISKTSSALTLATSIEPTNYASNAGPVYVDAQLVLAGPSETSLAAVTIHISNGFEVNDQLIFTNTADITSSYNPATGILSLSGTASLDIWQSALQRIQYKSNSLTPGLATRTITFTLSDNSTTLTATKEISMTYIPVISVPAQHILYVKKNASGNQTGSDWDHAIPELATALKWAHENKGRNLWNASNPLKIYVAKGLYKPMYSAADNNFGHDDGRKNTFLLVKDVELYGGFDPENGIRERTDTRIFDEQDGSILSGDFNENDVVTGSGETLTFLNNEENAYNVLVGSNELGVASVDGFTVQKGYANAENSYSIVNEKYVYHYYGAGITISYSSPLLQNIHVKENKTIGNGGGMFLGTSNAKLDNIDVHHNEAVDGGGIDISYSSTVPVLNNLKVRYNKSANSGGGIYILGASPKINNALITHNFSQYYTSAISNENFSNLLLTNSVVANNTIEFPYWGSTIRNNDTRSSIKIINCVVAGNNGGLAVLENGAGDFKIHNSLVIGNQHPLTGTFDIKHSIVQGKAAEPENGNPDGNIDVNILFNDYLNGDYTLKNDAASRTMATNPAINAGNNSLYDFTIYGILDASGASRIRDEAIDLGAFEIQEGRDPLPVRLISFSGNRESNVVNLAWQTAEEVNTDYFEIQQSPDGKNFKAMGRVEASFTGNHSYIYQDKAPLSSTSYYRLKMVDVDGRYSFSRIISIDGHGTPRLTLYPNPLSANQVLTLENHNATGAVLYDIIGRVVHRFYIQAGKHPVSLPRLVSGIYFIKTEDGQAHKLMVQ